MTNQRLKESSTSTAGNILIGHTLNVSVSDTLGNQFTRPMEVGEFYPADAVLMKDRSTGQVVVLQYNADESAKLPRGVVYVNSDPDTGITYKMVVIEDTLVDDLTQPTTVLTEAIRSISGYKLK